MWGPFLNQNEPTHTQKQRELMYLAPPSGRFSFSSEPSTSSVAFLFFSNTIALVLLKKWGSMSLRRLSDISIPMRFSYALASLSLAYEQISYNESFDNLSHVT